MDIEIETDNFSPDGNTVAMVGNVLLKQTRTGGKRQKCSCLTVFLSDIHLGTAESKADEVAEFLKHIRSRKLVLNGDIIDGWALRRGGRWRSSHSRVTPPIWFHIPGTVPD